MDPDVYSPSEDYTPAPETKTPFEKLGAGFVDFIQTLVVFGAIFAIIYLFIAQPHKVSGSSMVPAFHDGDFILTDKVSYRVTGPKVGDVIVLKDPLDESKDFIKRIIATSGQTLKVEKNSIFINGRPLDENYLPGNTLTRNGQFLHEGESVIVAPGEYFVFGDNRGHSSDSREWGPIKKEAIVGKVFFRYWPPNSFGLIRHSSS
ncbi:MAG: signal peptidase I [Microgenomates group bacterium Gr01-1014_80]|nr:MAG: signal peptidase I [Microgenomates group bacterium Gr01-1014_80]